MLFLADEGVKLILEITLHKILNKYTSPSMEHRAREYTSLSVHEYWYAKDKKERLTELSRPAPFLKSKPKIKT